MKHRLQTLLKHKIQWLVLLTALLGVSQGVWATWYVRGSFPGHDWDAYYALNGDNSVTITLNEGDYEFKLDNGSWNDGCGKKNDNASCGSECSIQWNKGGNIGFKAPQDGNYTFTFNLSSSPSVTITCPTPSCTTPTSVTAKANNSSSGCSIDMCSTTSVSLSVTPTEGSGTQQYSWSVSPSEGVSITNGSTSTPNATFTAAGSYTFTVKVGCDVSGSDYESDDVVVTVNDYTYNVSNDGWCGSSWSTSGCAMSKTNSIYSKTIESVSAGTHKFQLTRCNSWDWKQGYTDGTLSKSTTIPGVSSITSEGDGYGSTHVVFTTTETLDITVYYDGTDAYISTARPACATVCDKTIPSFSSTTVGSSDTQTFVFDFGAEGITTSSVSIIEDANTFFKKGTVTVDGTAKTVTVPVTYLPSSAGTHTAKIRISYSGGNYDKSISATAVTPTVIRVKIDAGWSTPIKVYTWGGGEYFGSFPGVEMTSLGCNWYEYRTSGSVGTDGIIFSGNGCTDKCGENQSKNATDATANSVNCYTVSSTKDSGDSNKRTVTKSGTCSSEFTSVTISNASVCVGSTVTLTKSSDPSTDVSWSFSSSSPSKATVNEYGVVTGVAAGSATITATASKSGYICKTATCTVTINANPTKPTISSYDASVCSNTAPTFTVATVSGVTYQMYTSADVESGDAVVADATSETLTADAITSATTYYVKATKSGCSVNSDNTNEITIRGTVAVKSTPTFTNPGIGNSQTKNFTFDVCGGALPTNFAVKVWNPSSGSDAECTTCPFTAGTPSYSDGVCTIPVTFSPTASGTFTARLKLTWSGGNLLTNDFSATAACTITPTADNYVLGNNSYTYAPNTPRSVTVNKASGSEAYPTGTIYYAGSTDAPTNANTYAITYSTSETGNYCAASGLELGNLVISKANQAALSITTGTSNRCTSATPFTLEVSGGTTSGTVTYTATSTTGTVSLNTSTGVISASTDGSITVTATMAGNGNYNSVTSDAKTFTFSQSPTISLSGSSIGGTSATYPWEYMTITATTTPSTVDVTWTKTFTGGSEPANSVTESGDHNHTYKIKSAITASPNSDHYTIKANGSNSGCAAAEAEYNVYINAAPAEVCN